MVRSHLRVTLGAGDGVVRRVAENLLIYEERKLLTVTFDGKFRISVALETPPRGRFLRLCRSAADFVRLVTLHTRRNFVRLLFPEPSLDDLDVDLFDASVAGHTHAGNVLPCNRRLGVVVIEDVMRGVARTAHRCHGQTLLEESFAMHRHRKVFENAILGNLVLERNLRPFTVASAAEQWDVDNVGGSRRIGVREDCVMIMTDDAVGCGGIPFDGGPSVERSPVLRRHLLVAFTTGFDLSQRFHRCHHLVASVAIHAVGRRVSVDDLGMRAVRDLRRDLLVTAGAHLIDD
jgi:hypothetical protein